MAPGDHNDSWTVARNRRHRRSGRPWTACGCGKLWLYNEKITASTKCGFCGTFLAKEKESHESDNLRFVGKATQEMLQARYKAAMESGNKQMADFIVEVHPEVAKSQEKKPLQALQDVSQRLASAEKKMDKCFDRAANLRKQADDAEKEALQNYIDVQKLKREVECARKLFSERNGILESVGGAGAPAEKCKQVWLPQKLQEDPEITAVLNTLHTLIEQKGGNGKRNEPPATIEGDDDQGQGCAKQRKLGGEDMQVDNGVGGNAAGSVCSGALAPTLGSALAHALVPSVAAEGARTNAADVAMETPAATSGDDQSSADDLEKRRKDLVERTKRAAEEMDEMQTL